MSSSSQQSQRWSWFLNMVFGAIAALAIEKYEPVVRQAWADGTGAFALSVFVALCACSFAVYDIAVYQQLADKYPYRMSVLGFARFYLDIVMAFVLYLLLTNALGRTPDWLAIVVAASAWNLAALVWHLLARREAGQTGGEGAALMPHLLFIVVYWLVAGIAQLAGSLVLGLDDAALSRFVLVFASATLLLVALFRWNQVIDKVLV